MTEIYVVFEILALLFSQVAVAGWREVYTNVSDLPNNINVLHAKVKRMLVLYF